MASRRTSPSCSNATGPLCSEYTTVKAKSWPWYIYQVKARSYTTVKARSWPWYMYDSQGQSKYPTHGLEEDIAVLLKRNRSAVRYSSQFQNNHSTEMCSGSETGSYLRLIDSCITQLKVQGPSRTCNESEEEEEEDTGSRRTSPSFSNATGPSSSSLLLSRAEWSDTHSLCALNTSPPRNRNRSAVERI